MALKQQTQTSKPSPGKQTQGPVQAEQGGLPPNPSDAIFQGRALPIRPAQAEVLRRPFQDDCVTKNPLHYYDGPGTDEIVTSRRPVPKATSPSLMDKTEHTDIIGDPPGRDEYFGKDPNKYSANPDDAYTTNGQLIRGS